MPLRSAWAAAVAEAVRARRAWLRAVLARTPTTETAPRDHRKRSSDLHDIPSTEAPHTLTVLSTGLRTLSLPNLT